MSRSPSGARKVLVTGAAGFIGSHLCEALLRRGDTVVGLDNFDPYYDPLIKHQNIAWALEQPNYHFVKGDVREISDLNEAFSHGPFDATVHLAARAGVRPSIAEPLEYQDVNVVGTTALLEQVRSKGGGHFVFGSSSSVYGATSKAPFREDDVADRPSSPYAATKRSGELVCYSYHHLYGIDVACLRFFTVYGPRQRPEMAIHMFTRLIDEGEEIRLFGDGSSKRDYTFVDDIIAGVISAIDHPSGYAIYNLGATGLTRLDELVEMIAQRLNKPLKIRWMPDQPGDVPLTHADISVAQRELEYEVTTPLASGLDKFVEWYRSSLH